MTDHAAWDRVLGYTWPERERMQYLKDHNPRLYPGPYDATDTVDLVDPDVAAAVAGPLLLITWHGAPDRPVDVG